MIKPAVVAMFVALTVAVPTLPAAAAPGPGKAGRESATASASKGCKPDRRAEHGSDKRDRDKPCKPKRKAVVHQGRLTAVDLETATLTMSVKGGTERELRGGSVSVVVPESAQVRRGEVAATLAELVVGDRVTVKGVRFDGVLTIERVRAKPAESDDDSDDSADSHD